MRTLLITIVAILSLACKDCGLSRIDAQWQAVTKVMLEMSDTDARYRLIQHVRGAPLWYSYPRERPISLGDLRNWHRAKRMFNKLSRRAR